MYLGGSDSFCVVVDGHFFVVDVSPIYGPGHKNRKWMLVDIGSASHNAKSHAHSVRDLLVHTLHLLHDNDYAGMTPREFIYKVLETRIDVDDGRQIHSGG